MSVRVRNIAPDFFHFWDAAAGKPADEQKRLWIDVYEEPNRSLFDIYYSQWASPKYLEAALPRFSAASVAQIRSLDADHAINHALASCSRVFDLPEPQMDYVVMVGIFSSNGWAIRVDGVPTSFFALECFREQKYLDMLAAHEAAHSYHNLLLPGGWADFSVIGNLFKEGVATFASALACPGLSEDEYLWFNPGFASWVTECEERWPQTQASLTASLDGTDFASYGRYFMGGGDRSDGLPMRCGYYAGYRIVRTLAEQYSLAEMARWAPDQADAEVRLVLENLT